MIYYLAKEIITPLTTIELWWRDRRYKVMIRSGKQQFPIMNLETVDGDKAWRHYENLIQKAKDGKMEAR